MMLGRPIDENVPPRKSFGQRGAQFEFADHLDGPAVAPPPAEQRRNRLGFAREPVAAGDFRFSIFDRRLKTSGGKRLVKFGNPFRDGQR